MTLFLGLAAGNYLFVLPRGFASLYSPEQALGLVLYLVVGLAIVLLAGAQQRARLRAQINALMLQQEIEGHKRTEQALRESEERLRLATECGGLIVWDSSLITQSVICSPNAKEIWGRDRGTVSDFLANVYPEDRSLFALRREEAAAGRVIPVVEYRVVDQEGRMRWLQSRGDVRFGSDGRPVRFIGVSVDVTHRKEMEEKLRASEERFSSFMRYLPGAAWIKDHKGHYAYANPTALDLFRTTEQQLYGKADGEIFPTETARQFQENDRKVVKSGQGLQMIEALSQPDGWHYFLVSKFPIFDNTGGVSFIGSIAFDITRWKKAEEEREVLLARVQEERRRLQESQAQLEEKLQELEAFHDVVVGRELRMMQIEKENHKLRAEIEWLRAGKS